MIVERLFHSGGLEIYQEVNGELVSRRYFDYTRKESIADFRSVVRSIKRGLRCKTNRTAA